MKVTGATVHFVDEGTDTGPILLQKAVAIQPDDTPEVLQRRVMEQAEWIILPQAIDAIAPRPWNIAKFSEFYLIAAEAAVKLNKNDDAKRLVNVLRARAGKQTYCVNKRAEQIADHSAEMLAATPATITIDYILDERSREFWGEGYRWFDLVRTQKWAERATTYHIAGSGYTDKDLQEFKRDIPAGYYLRPIPQGQLDGMEMDPAEKAAYQNPAYRD